MRSVYVIVLLFLFSVSHVSAAPVKRQVVDEPIVVQVTSVPADSITPTPSLSPADSVTPTPSLSSSDSVTPMPSSSLSPTEDVISPSPTADMSPTSSPAPTSVSNNIVATPTDKPTPIQSVSQVVQEAYQPPNPVISSIAKFIIPQDIYRNAAQTRRLSLELVGMAFLFLLIGMYLIRRTPFHFLQFKLKKMKEVYHCKSKRFVFTMLRHLL